MARQLRTLLGGGHFSVVGAAYRLRLLAARQLPAGPAPGRACLTTDRSRGLHGGPSLEERTWGAASEGRPESRLAGTGAG